MMHGKTGMPSKEWKKGDDTSKDTESLGMLLNWLDRKDDSGFRGYFVSGQKSNDLDALVHHYTAPALARALRDREELLAECATLACSECPDMKRLRELLGPFSDLPSTRHFGESQKLELDELENEPEGTSSLEFLASLGEGLAHQGYLEGGLFHHTVLERLRTRLNRLPREISSRARKRASVIIPLCRVNGEASILFTKRSDKVNRHKGEVCFPGGMIDDSDPTVVDAGLRELHEEVGIPPDVVDVLGILRCDWSEVASITGVAVTPVVGYLGEYEDLVLNTNPGEVASSFTIPMSELLTLDNWIIRNYSPPVFRKKDAPPEQVVWGLTGYILHRFISLLPSVVFDNQVTRAAFLDN